MCTDAFRRAHEGAMCAFLARINTPIRLARRRVEIRDRRLAGHVARVSHRHGATRKDSPWGRPGRNGWHLVCAHDYDDMKALQMTPTTPWRTIRRIHSISHRLRRPARHPAHPGDSGVGTSEAQLSDPRRRRSRSSRCSEMIAQGRQPSQHLCVERVGTRARPRRPAQHRLRARCATSSAKPRPRTPRVSGAISPNLAPNFEWRADQAAA